MGDNLNTLPVDDTPLSDQNQQIMDNLFQKNGYDMTALCMGLKTSLVAGGLFLLFSMPYVDTALKKIIPVTSKSNLYLIFMKTLLYMLTYFLITNYHLAFK